MSIFNDLVAQLRLAEIQFSLAISVNYSIILKEQQLIFPEQWADKDHVVNYEELKLSQDQAEQASFFLKQTATLIIAECIKKSVQEFVNLKAGHRKPDIYSDPIVGSTFKISRYIRNAFMHSPFAPKWGIDGDDQDKTFSVPSVIDWNTNGLNAKKFEWEHIGGHLTLFKLSKFVRYNFLEDKPENNESAFGKNRQELFQIGKLILRKVSKLPDGLVETRAIDFFKSMD